MGLSAADAHTIGWEDGLPDSEPMLGYNPAPVIALAHTYR